MNVKKIAGTAAIAGALGAAALGLGAGTAQADDWVPWVPWVPHVDDWLPHVDDWVDWGRGPTGLGPPGQIKNDLCPGLPPGHWWPAGPHSPIPCIPGG